MNIHDLSTLEVRYVFVNNSTLSALGRSTSRFNVQVVGLGEIKNKVERKSSNKTLKHL